MNKNVVFMTAVQVDEFPLRSRPYKYGIASWKKWCEKNNCELFVLDEMLHPNDVMRINFHRYYAFDILDANDIEYDQILLTDADCVIHPDCPNFFEMTGHSPYINGAYTVTHADGSYDWVVRSMEAYALFMFDLQIFTLDSYFNAGFQVVNKSHRHIFDKLIKFYFENKDEIIHMQKTFSVGTDQPIINFLVNLEAYSNLPEWEKKHSDFNIKMLHYQFCMVDMFRKEILDEELTMTKVFPGIYQFNAIPDNPNADKTLYWMKKTYEHLYGELNE